VGVGEDAREEIALEMVNETDRSKIVKPIVVPVLSKRPELQVAKAQKDDVLGASAAKSRENLKLSVEERGISDQTEITASSSWKEALVEQKRTSFVRTTLSIIYKIAEIFSSLLARINVAVN
jgi:hypothetical protein